MDNNNREEDKAHSFSKSIFFHFIIIQQKHIQTKNILIFGRSCRNIKKK